METPLTPFTRATTPDPQQRLLSALSPQEIQYVIAMATRLGITFMQAARQLAREKEEASR